MVDKIKSLESKLQFYETEHNNYQNQLLMQRKSHEEEIKQLKLTISTSQAPSLTDNKDKQIEEL